MLDKVKVEYDYKHPTLVTITIDAFNNPTSTTPPPPETDEWRLPTYDPRNETKYLYRLQSFDIYLWTREDAQVFMDTVQRVLPSHHVSITGEPPAPAAHAAAMSPIVQQLENVAIAGHAPHQAGYAQDAPAAAAPSFPGPPQAAPSFPGPPQAPPPAPAPAFTPMAYNPAAPAAPEAIAHREKTPPPPDGAANPLSAAAAHDHAQPYAAAAPPQTSYFPGPPSAAAGQYAPGSTPAASPSAPQQQQAQYQPQQQQQQSAVQSYAGSAAPGAGDYSIHQQVYTPGEGEAPVKKPAEAAGSHKLGLGQNAARLEKGVTGFLRKFEKKYA